MKKVFIVALLSVMSLELKAQDTAAVTDYSVTLREVAVLKTDKTKELQLGDSKKMVFLPEPQTTSWMLGRKFESQGDFRNLKKVIFYAKSAVDSGLCKVQIFEIGSNGLPSESLLSEEVLVEVKKGNQKIAIDVSKYNIELPENGIVVAFESLVLEQNKYFLKAFNTHTKEKISVLNYAPHIKYFYDNEKDSYVFSAGKWVHYSVEYNLDHPKTPIPAIDVIVSN